MNSIAATVALIPALSRLVENVVLDEAELGELSREVCLSEVWKDLVVVNTEYRDYRLLFENASVEVWVLSWMPGQMAGFHDHYISSVGICVCEGTLRERHMCLGQQPHSHLLKPGQVQTGGLGYIHEVSHKMGAPAVSIHSYSPRLDWVGQYRSDERGVLRRHPASGRTTRLT